MSICIISDHIIRVEAGIMGHGVIWVTYLKTSILG